jgi:hypothetical protein
MSHRGSAVSVLVLLQVACNSPASPSLPNVQGAWQGSWHATTCAGSGPFASETCANLQMSDHTLYLRITQTNQSLRSYVFACMEELEGVPGTISGDSSFTLVGSGVLPPYDPWTLNALNATVSGTSLTGTFSCSIPRATYQFTLSGTIRASLYSRDPNGPPYS